MLFNGVKYLIDSSSNRPDIEHAYFPFLYGTCTSYTAIKSTPMTQEEVYFIKGQIKCRFTIKVFVKTTNDCVNI